MTSIHRGVLFPVYLPAVFLGVPAQAVLILLPLYVLELGGSVAAASAVVGLRGVGMMVADIPAGMLAARFGDRVVMLFAMILIGSAYLTYALVNEVSWFYLLAFINGAGSSTFLLGRMSYITAACSPRERGRVISMIAGSMRGAALLGPLAGAALAEFIGFEATFMCLAATVVLGFLCVAMTAIDDPPDLKKMRWRAVTDLAFEYRGVFATAGIASITFMLMRAARTVLIPLLGAELGLETTVIGLVVSVSAIIDVALFYPAGMIMDRHGRRATAVPSSILFAAALAALSLANGFYSLLAVAIVLGVANGLSTGIVMTLGTDLAPAARRGEFLGLWRLLTDLGSAAGPLTVSLAVTLGSIQAAALCVGALGAAGSLVVYRFVEETLKR